MNPKNLINLYLHNNILIINKEKIKMIKKTTIILFFKESNKK